MITKKQVKETYKGKLYDANDPFSEVTTISYFGNYAILLSGHYDRFGAGYDIEACIDRRTGENVIVGRSRPCDDKVDAIDVVNEMIKFD